VNDGHEEEINNKMMKRIEWIGLGMGRKRKGCTNQGDVSDRDRQLRRRVGRKKKAAVCGTHCGYSLLQRWGTLTLSPTQNQTHIP